MSCKGMAVDSGSKIFGLATSQKSLKTLLEQDLTTAEPQFMTQVDHLPTGELVFAVIFLGEFWALDGVLVVAGDLGKLLFDLLGLEIGLQ